MKEPRTRARTLRALPLAFLWIAVQSAVGGYMHGNSVGQLIANHLPLGAMFYLILLAFLLNPLLSRLSPRLTLTTAELALIWALVTAASAVPGYGMMEFLFPFLAAPLYFATPENQWREVLFPHLPNWLYVSDPRAVQTFFDGLRRGEPIPWAAWWKPAGFWIAFSLLFFFGLLWWSLLLRRQWAERERYAFPLVQVAAHLTEVEGPGRALNRTLRSPLLWTALGLMFVHHLLNGLHNYFPIVPRLKVYYSIAGIFRTKPWYMLARSWPLSPFLYFSVIGVTYFLHLDVALSIWFFFVFYKLQQVFFSAYSITQVNTQQQAMGGFVVLIAVVLWNARRHLLDVLRKARDPSRTDIDDSDEPSSYRTAVVGMLFCFALLVFLCLVMGMSLWVALVFVALLLLMATTVAWEVANAGLLLVNIGFSPYGFLTTILGSRPLGPRNLVLLGFDRSSMEHWSSESLMPYTLQNYRLFGIHRIRSRGLPWLMMLAILFAVAVAYVASLTFIYREGAVNLEYWVYRLVGRIGLGWAAGAIQSPFPPNPVPLMSMGVGAVFMAFLLFMRHNFLWWPFHPLGYVMGVTYSPHHLWFGVFVGWAVKLMIVKFGGFGTYRRMRPFFLGLILGEYFMTGVWSFIGLFTGRSYWGLPH